ncbi:hypothetical protein COT78_03500 [Candidatus Berkelbacteria bacterium CG10_big_fil_rev_8_21_14_0_10_43_13]|uniref:Uncharacterized protein n=1 Tax=Candidatus Berkelbacteria bacterium CG10_big_fil_rev_8_21_14_0_10_43_13 TaxID=1974514 RepID=A0A2H0W7X0_9BACT|nr:MAG: hypothetical protein COT78_03500 [Candidatus Berkelbacteria bacterium CG10_big_fil_rev_8_21_14_0_10_43_13]
MAIASSTSTSSDVAKAILGENYITLEEAAWCFRDDLAHDTARQFARIPFSAETLGALASTHVLIPDLAVPIRDLRLLVQGNFLRLSQKLEDQGQALQDLLCFSEDGWYVDLPFAEFPYPTEPPRYRWKLIARAPLADSYNLGLNDQLKLIGAERKGNSGHDRIVAARELVYTIVVVLLTRGECLYKEISGRCIDPVTEMQRVTAGCSCQKGQIVINQVAEEDRDPKLGLATARVPNRP